MLKEKPIGLTLTMFSVLFLQVAANADFTEHQRGCISELVADLGVDDWSRRNAAEEEIVFLLRPVAKSEYLSAIDFLKGKQIEQPDPEIELRLNRCIGYLKYKFETIIDEIKADLFGNWVRGVLESGDEQRALCLQLDLAAGDGRVELRGTQELRVRVLAEHCPMGITGALHSALFLSGRPNIVKLLLELGADPEERNEYGETAIFYAYNGGCEVDGIKALLERDVNINVQDHQGYTPLMRAIELNRSVAAVRVLLDFKADVTMKNNDGFTAIEIARSKNASQEIIEMLERAEPK